MTFEQWVAQQGYVQDGPGLYRPADPYSENGQAANFAEGTLRDQYASQFGLPGWRPVWGSAGQGGEEVVNANGVPMQRIGGDYTMPTLLHGGVQPTYDPTYGWMMPLAQYLPRVASGTDNFFGIYGPAIGAAIVGGAGLGAFGGAAGATEGAAVAGFGGTAGEAAAAGAITAGEIGGASGYGAAAGGAAGGAAGALPDSYWSMLADSGTGAATDAGATGAGTFGAEAGAGYALPGSPGGLPSTLSTTLPSFTEGAGALSAADVSALQALGYSSADIAAAGGGAALSSAGFSGGGTGGGGSGFLSGVNWQQLVGPALSGISSLNQANAAERAAELQTAASQQAIDEQRRQFDLARGDTQVYRDTGAGANLRLRGLLGIGPNTGASDYGSLLRRFNLNDLNTDPVYQTGLKFGLDEGTKGINARAIGSGMYDSGATLKALTRFGNDYGTTKAEGAYNRFNVDQGNIFNRLSGISGTGQAAVGQVTSAGQGATNNISELLTGAGNARAAGVVGGANAWGSGAQAVNSAINNYQTNEILQKLLRDLNNNSSWASV